MVVKSWRYGRKDVERLLEKRAGFGAEPLKCSKESSELLMCWATSQLQSADPKCASYEAALRRCEVGLGNSIATKARRDIKRTLIYELLRYANKLDSNKIVRDLKD